MIVRGKYEWVLGLRSVYDENGKKNAPSGTGKNPGERVEIARLEDIPIKKLRFERSSFDLFERIPLDSVMTPKLEYDISGSKMLEQLKNYRNPLLTIADAPLYIYDLGDNWSIRITVSDDCRDLVELGRVTQEQVDNLRSSAGNSIGQSPWRWMVKCAGRCRWNPWICRFPADHQSGTVRKDSRRKDCCKAGKTGNAGRGHGAKLEETESFE